MRIFMVGQIKLGGICQTGKKVAAAADQNIQLERTFDGAACAMCLTLKYMRKKERLGSKHWKQIIEEKTNNHSAQYLLLANC